MRELGEAVRKYRESHPEIDEVMRIFEVSQEELNRARAAIRPQLRQPIRDQYVLEPKEQYFADVQ